MSADKRVRHGVTVNTPTVNMVWFGRLVNLRIIVVLCMDCLVLVDLYSYLAIQIQEC